MNFYQRLKENNIMRIIRTMLGTRKMFSVFILLILTVLCYLTISYQQITCPTKDIYEKSSDNKGEFSSCQLIVLFMISLKY